MAISRRNKGVTLIEVLVVVMLLGFVTGAALMTLQTGRTTWAVTNNQIRLQEDLRKILQRVPRELKESGMDKNGVAQVTIFDGTGVNGSDILRFSIPIICEAGNFLIDANADIAYWGAPLTWGCVDSTCMDADDDCAIAEYKYLEYKIVNTDQFARRVLNDDTPPALVRQDVIAENITDFQVEGCFEDITIINNLAMLTGGTTLTSTGGGFGPGMAGRYIRITSGTNFVTGLYQISSFTNANAVVLDRDATNLLDASDGSGRITGDACREPTTIITSLAMVTGGTTLTSSSGGFTSDMVNKSIEIIKGPDFVLGSYEITGFVDTNTVILASDATNGSNASGGTGHVGGEERGAGLMLLNVSAQIDSISKQLSTRVYLRNYL